jgi:26S proteasome regulatory subunit N8
LNLIQISNILARERIVGWYHTGPKLHRNDISINELIREYHPDSVLVIIDAKPKDLGLPTEAYIAVEEIHDVRSLVYERI